MKCVLSTLPILLLLSVSPAAHAQMFGSSPLGRSPVYQYQTLANQSGGNTSGMSWSYTPSAYGNPSQQAWADYGRTYGQSAQQPNVTPQQLPRDAYWGMGASGQVTYFRPGHPLGNLMRAFGYNGPPLTP